MKAFSIYCPKCKKVVIADGFTQAIFEAYPDKRAMIYALREIHNKKHHGSTNGKV